MQEFHHEKLDVYRAAIELVVLIDNVVENFPRGRAYLVDQVQRAGTSVPLNIAEGAGEYSSNEKSRFYRMAKRSATECAAIFDVCLAFRARARARTRARGVSFSNICSNFMCPEGLCDRQLEQLFERAKIFILVLLLATRYIFQEYLDKVTLGRCYGWLRSATATNRIFRFSTIFATV